MKTVSAAEANRHFSSLLRDISQGEEVVVTSRGKPVATIRPVSAGHSQRKVAKAVLLARLQIVPVTGIRDWQRDDLYD